MKKILSFLMVALFSVTMFAATETKVYYAVPAETVGDYTVKIRVNRQGDAENWAIYEMQKTALTHETMDVYKVTFTDLYDGLGCMQFQLWDGETWISEIKVFDWKWTNASVYNGKMWVHGGDAWIDAPADVPDVTLYFVNAEDWTDVHTFVFYKKGTDPAVEYKAYPGEAMIKTGKKLKGKDVYSYTFPETYDKIGFVEVGGTHSTSNYEWNTLKPYYYEDGDGVASNNWYAKEDLIENVTLYFVNDEDWTTVNAYVFGDGNYKAWPGEAMTLTEEKVNEKDIYSYTFPNNYTFIIFNDGTTQTADLEYDAAKPYWSQAQRDWYATAAEVPGAVIPAKFYICGTAVGGWNPAAVKSTEDTYTINDLEADTEYALKVTEDGTWGTAKGYSDLTEKAAGLREGDSNNILFKLATAGSVKVTYTTDPVEFKLEGNFKAEATGVDNTAATVKAVKSLENGMLIIEKNGVRFNAQGQMVR